MTVTRTRKENNLEAISKVKQIKDGTNQLQLGLIDENGGNAFPHYCFGLSFESFADSLWGFAVSPLLFVKVLSFPPPCRRI